MSLNTSLCSQVDILLFSSPVAFPNRDAVIYWDSGIQLYITAAWWEVSGGHDCELLFMPYSIYVLYHDFTVPRCPATSVGSLSPAAACYVLQQGCFSDFTHQLLTETLVSLDDIGVTMLSHQRHISDKTGPVFCPLTSSDYSLQSCRCWLLLHQRETVSRCSSLEQPRPSAISSVDCKCTRPIKMEPDSLVTKSMRSCPLMWETAVPEILVSNVTFFLPLPSPFFPLLAVCDTAACSIEVLSESSKWIVVATAVDQRRVFCFFYTLLFLWR